MGPGASGGGAEGQPHRPGLHSLNTHAQRWALRVMLQPLVLTLESGEALRSVSRAQATTSKGSPAARGTRAGGKGWEALQPRASRRGC